MLKPNQIILILILLCFGIIDFVLAGSFEYGLATFQQGNYAAAFRLWKPLAEKGHPLAQYNLGVMYYEGYGVPQNYGQAVEWFLRAAHQNHNEAQRNIGVMYYEGQGVPQDDSKAYMWFEIAALNGNQAGEENCKIVAKRMTSMQISEAKNLAHSWRPSLSVVPKANNNQPSLIVK